MVVAWINVEHVSLPLPTMNGPPLSLLSSARSIFLFLVLSIATLTQAESFARNPLRLLSIVSDPSIHTSTQRVNAYSNFDLTFNAFNGHRQIRLSLEPNHDIIPDGAQVNYMDAEGNIHRSEPIDRLEHKVFKGVARQARADGSWTTVGWARCSIIRDGVHPIFEGAFTVGQDAHHIQTRTNYMRTKVDLDPEAEDSHDEYMVVWRDSDISASPAGPALHTELRRDLLEESLQQATCSSDDLHFNNDLQHPVYAELLRRTDSHWGVMPVGSLFGKRQIDSQLQH